ncbi:unnamed protein product [Closterium sp. NIES-53]
MRDRSDSDSEREENFRRRRGRKERNDSRDSIDGDSSGSDEDARDVGRGKGKARNVRRGGGDGRKDERKGRGDPKSPPEDDGGRRGVGKQGGGGGDGGAVIARSRGRHDLDDESDEERGGSDGGKGGGRDSGRGGKGKTRGEFKGEEEERAETKKSVGGRRGERDREEEEEEEGGERWEMGGGRERVRVGRKEKRGEKGRRGGRAESEEREDRDKVEGRRERDQMRARDGLGEGERERDVIRGREGGRGRESERGRGRDDVDGRRREREDDGGRERRRDGEMERERERDGRRGRDRSGRHRRGGSDTDGSESSGEWERERERERGGVRGRGREDRHRRHEEGRREEGRRDRGRGDWEGEERRSDGRGAPVRAPNADAAATPAPTAAATAGGAADPGAGPAAGKAAAARDTGRTGGAYIPPFKLARMLQEVNDRSSAEYQRLTWDALRKSINGLVNKVNASNIKNIIPELFGENLVRGRGLLCRACIKSQMASPTFTHVFAALVAVVNTKFPELGELLLKRIILQFRRAFRRNDKWRSICLLFLPPSPFLHRLALPRRASLPCPVPYLQSPISPSLPLPLSPPTAAGAGGGVSLLGPRLQAAGGSRESRARAASLPCVSAPPTSPTPPSPFLLQPVLVAACRFLAHLCNQQVAHEIVALELLTLLLETPTDDSVEVAVSFVKECGAMLQDLSPQGLHSIFERFRGILHEGEIDKRVQFTIEGLFAIRKAKFEGFPAVLPELDLVEEEDQITHELSLEEPYDPETSLDVFKFDPDYLANEQRYKEIKAEILGDEEEDEDEKGEGGGDDDDDEEDEESSEEEEDEEEQAKQQEIRDETETNLVNLRRTIYLTIMASVNFEEAGHKLMKVNLQPGQEMELCEMLLACCSQERTYLRYYGLLGQRFCMLNRAYQECFEQCFVKQYSMIHRLETNKLRNVAKLFAHFLATDAMPWALLSYIRLTEEDTSSSSRIFIKIMFQEMSEQLGLRKMNERLSDPTMGAAFDGIFPKDTPKNTRFAINFFTSIGLGGLTDNLREHLKNMPKLIMQQQKPVQVSESESESESDSESDSESESDTGSDSGSDSGSESESESSESGSSESEDSRDKKRRRKK